MRLLTPVLITSSSSWSSFMFQVRSIHDMNRYLGMKRRRAPPYEPRYTGELSKRKDKFPYFGKHVKPLSSMSEFRYTTPAKFITNIPISIEYSFSTARVASVIRQKVSERLCGATVDTSGRMGGSKTDLMMGRNHQYLKITKLSDGVVLFNSEDFTKGQF